MAKRLAALSFLMLLALPLSVAAEPRQVLLLHSFEREFAPFDAFAGNFRAELTKNSPVPINFYEVSLQPVRSNENPQEKPILDYMHAMFANRRLDLVVPIGGLAVRFAQKYRQELFPETPMLLAATDQRHLNMAAVTSNDAIVGVLNDGPLIIDNILQLFPHTTRVCVVLGNSPLEKFWRDELELEFQRFKGRVTFDWLNDLSFEEILERSATLPSNSAIFYVLLSVDAKGVSQTESRGLTELHAVANAPIFGFHGSQLGRGIVGGPLMSIVDLSRNAAGVAVRILDGESPEHLSDGTATAWTADVRLARTAPLGHPRGSPSAGQHRPISRADSVGTIQMADYCSPVRLSPGSSPDPCTAGEFDQTTPCGTIA